MDKMLLLSLRPEWAAEIAAGNKPIEIRKNEPVYGPPFTVFMYCCGLYKTPMKRYDALFARTNGRIDEWAGKVFGAFVCDKVDRFVVSDDGQIQGWDYFGLSRSLLTYSQLWDYVWGGRYGYSWHISDLRIFDNPLPLSDFWCRGQLKHPPVSWCYARPTVRIPELEGWAGMYADNPVLTPAT